MNVYLSENIAPTARKRLASCCTIVNNFDHPEELDGILVRRAEVTGDILRKARRLRIVSMHGVGLDHIDVDTARQLGIPVTNVPGVNAESVAELSVTMMMALLRKLKYIDACVEKGALHTFGDNRTVGHEIYGKKIGLVGSGHIAQRVAAILKNAFECQIFSYNEHETAAELERKGMTKVDSLEGLFRLMDIVSVHVPLTAQTKNMINQNIFGCSNPNLYLVNTARGGIVNEEDLYEALCNGKIAGAASDVFSQDIPDTHLPLLHLPNFISTVHVGGSTAEAMERVSNQAVDNLLAGLKGENEKIRCVWEEKA